MSQPPSALPAPSRLPQVYTLGEEVHDLFAVPVAGAVGAPSGAGVTLLHLGDDGSLRHEETELSLPEGVALVSGDTRFLPPLDRKRIACVQARRVLIADLASRSVVKHRVCHWLEECIAGAWRLDGRGLRLLLDVNEYGAAGTAQRLLRVVDLSAQAPAILGERRLGPRGDGNSAPLAAQGETVLLYDVKAHTLTALDAGLAPVNHPLAALLADQHRRLRRVCEMAVHPRLPLAVLIDRDPARNRAYAVHVARWSGSSPSIDPLPLSGAGTEHGRYYAGAEFSPDGRWLVLRDESADARQPVLMAAPVSEEQGGALGPPLVLGRTLLGPLAATAWVTEPLSFVVCDGAALYRWRLDQA